MPEPDANSVTLLFDAFVARDSSAAIAVIEQTRDRGLPQSALLDQLFAPALSLLGGAWASGRLDEYAFTQAAVVAEQVSSFVIPPAAAADTGVSVLVGTIDGDSHGIATAIAAAALKQAGHRVLDLGTDVMPAVFLERAEESGARIALVGAETAATAVEVARVREHFEAAGRELVLLVTGGPFEADEALAREVGSNGVARGAESAMRLVGKAASRFAEAQ